MYKTMIQFCHKGVWMNFMSKEKRILLEQGKRICSVCGDIKLLESFSIGQTVCKVCQKEQRRRSTGYYIKNPPTEEEQCKQTMLPESTRARNMRLAKKGLHWCNLCKKELPLSCFYTNGKYTCNRCKTCVGGYSYSRRQPPGTESSHARNKRLAKEGLYWCRNCDQAYPIDPLHTSASSIGLCPRCKHKCCEASSKKRKAIDGAYRVKLNVSSSLRRALGKKKSGSASKWTGCSKQFLKDYLASLFTEGMSWDNYGEWHIDHIIPQAYFDFNNPDEVRMCWNYRNLQPLWGNDNIEKGANLPVDLDERLAILRAVCIPVQ